MNFLAEWKNNTEYFELLKLMARLSNLFSDSEIPFLHYRITENLFCKYFKAENLSRSDTAYDAKKDSFGIGIKTFTLTNGHSTEKVAEFNSISPTLKQYKGADLAYQIAKARNERMQLGQRLYAIQNGCYHIVGRVPGGLTVFNDDYPLINLNKITAVKDTGKSIQFCDDKNSYTYNFSKSTLFKEFYIAKDNVHIPVSIIQDPYEILKKLIETQDYNGKYDDIYEVHKIIQKRIQGQKQLVLGVNYVILPLFSTTTKDVPERSGLNQWNANGRSRDADEVYIPIPSAINKNFPHFFTERDVSFTLHLPNGSSILAKPCQQNRKALMSNPNTDLGKWILRDVLQLKQGELATMELLNRMGFDSVIIYKNSDRDYRIDVCRTLSYSDEMYEEYGEEDD